MDDPCPEDLNNNSESYDSEGSENNSDSEEIENNDDWNLDYKNEVKFWNELIKKGYIYKPDICPVCNYGKFELKNHNKKNINKIFYCRCSFIKCRKKSELRNFSIMRLSRNLPASIFFKIVEYFFFDELNARKITNKLQNEYNNKIHPYKIEKLLKSFRLLIYNHLKKKYATTLIGGFNELNSPKIVAIDESLLIHNSQNDQIWMLGGIETAGRRIRLSLSKTRTSEALSEFVYSNFFEGTHFVHDSWLGYNFFNNNLNYTHEVHVHGGGDFGNGLHSTSHIENYWAQFKKLLARIYGMIPKKNYVLYFREIEFRINMSYKNIEQKKIILKDIFKNLYLENQYSFDEVNDL